MLKHARASCNFIATNIFTGVHDSDCNYPDGIIPVPRPITLPLKKSSPRVVGLAAGRAHSLVLTNEGVFTLGNNGYGQCGRPIIDDENYNQNRVIHHIPDIKGEQITGVTAGQDHRYLNSPVALLLVILVFFNALQHILLLQKFWIVQRIIWYVMKKDIFLF